MSLQNVRSPFEMEDVDFVHLSPLLSALNSPRRGQFTQYQYQFQSQLIKGLNQPTQPMSNVQIIEKMFH